MIGERIRQRRTELGFSLRELGTRTGLTASFLSQIEHEQSTPSLASLQKIAAALDRPMFDFTEQARQPNPVIRANERPRLEFPDSPISYDLLTRHLGTQMMAFLIRLESGGRHIAEPLPRLTEQWMHVLNGRLEIKISAETYCLDIGDTIYYSGETLREFSAIGDEALQAICCIAPPAL